MKNKQFYWQLLLFAAISTILGGCWGTSGPTSTTNYTIKNKKEINEHNSYESGKLDFTMKTSNLQAPLLSQKGQVNTETWVGNGWGLNMSVAATNHLLLTFKYAGRSGEDSFDSQDTAYIREDHYTGGTLTNTTEYTELITFHFNQSSKQHIYEFGAGYYNTISDLFRYEAFGGVAYGLAETKYELTSNYYNENFDYYTTENREYFQYFAQGNIGLVTKQFEAAVLARVSYFNFTNQEFQTDYSFGTYDARNGNITLEPGIRVGAGGKTFRVFCQYEYALPLKETDMKWNRSQFLAGVLFRFNDKIKRPKD